MEDVKEPQSGSKRYYPQTFVSILVLMEDVKERKFNKSTFRKCILFQSLF